MNIELFEKFIEYYDPTIEMGDVFCRKIECCDCKVENYCLKIRRKRPLPVPQEHIILYQYDIEYIKEHHIELLI